MRQYFVDEKLSIGTIVSLQKNKHHIKDVLRMKNDDLIRLVDIEHQVFLSRLIINEEVNAEVIEKLNQNENEKEIIYCAAMIKKDNWEYVLQKATELGATTIVPLITSRTIIHHDQKDIDKKLERYNKIVQTAMQQSNRSDNCQVVYPIKLKDINLYKADINLLAYEVNKENYIKNYLEKDKSICFVIGPEGGFEQKEVDLLKEYGFISVNLGSRILRAETAGLYILSIIDSVRNS